MTPEVAIGTQAFVATGGNAEIAEMVEKTVMDAVPVQAILSYAYAGRNGDRASWDKACALYIGQPDLCVPHLHSKQTVTVG